jgi:glutathione S-transferase
MKLYYSPGACSLAPHIVICEVDSPCRLVRVDLGKHQLTTGEDYYNITPRGQVPLLELEDGQKLTEGPVISQYLAEKAGRKDLLPPSGELARYRVLEWLNFTTSELHKSFSPLFSKDFPDEGKAITRRALRQKYEWVAERLRGHDYTTGDNFTIADAYLFTVTNWAKNVDLNLTDLETLQAFLNRVKHRPAVMAAMKAEGLIE